MRRGTLLKSALLAAATFALASSANAASGVRIGTLTCSIESGWGHVVASRRDMDCVYQPRHRDRERYTGVVERYGVDLGHTRGGTLVWAVIAPTSNVGRTALEGTYGGVSANATVGVGGAANVLIGGFD